MLKPLACVCVEEMLCFKVQYVKGEELFSGASGVREWVWGGCGKAQQGGCF